MNHKSFLTLILVLFLLTGCASSDQQPQSAFNEFTFTHYSSGGTREEYSAVILFEQACSTFTAYQVAFISCTCRDSLVNYYSVCYVELLNTKPSSEAAAIRAITFGDNMGLYGDSNPNYYISEYTEDYMDEHFVQRLVGASKSEFDSWGGYGSTLSCVDQDAITGATVSTGNITSMLQSLFQYHAEKYYNE
jgi:hypothetical protein